MDSGIESFRNAQNDLESNESMIFKPDEGQTLSFRGHARSSFGIAEKRRANENVRQICRSQLLPLYVLGKVVHTGTSTLDDTCMHT